TCPRRRRGMPPPAVAVRSSKLAAAARRDKVGNRHKACTAVWPGLESSEAPVYTHARASEDSSPGHPRKKGNTAWQAGRAGSSYKTRPVPGGVGGDRPVPERKGIACSGLLPAGGTDGVDQPGGDAQPAIEIAVGRNERLNELSGRAVVAE